MGIIELEDVDDVYVDYEVADKKICESVKEMADELPVSDERKELFKSGKFVIASCEPEHTDLSDDENPVMAGEDRVLDFAEFGIEIEREDDDRGLLTVIVNKQKRWSPEKAEVQTKVAMVKKYLLEHYAPYFPTGKQSSDAFDRIAADAQSAEEAIEGTTTWRWVKDEEAAAKLIIDAIKPHNILGITVPPYVPVKDTLLQKLIGLTRDHAREYVREMHRTCTQQTGTDTYKPMGVPAYLKKPIKLTGEEEELSMHRFALEALPTYENVMKGVPEELKEIGYHDFANTLFILGRKREALSELYRREWDGEDWNDLRDSHTVDNGEYMIVTEDEASAYAYDYLEDNADELMGLYDVPEHVKQYVDTTAWMEEVISVDGVAHVIASYDGSVSYTESYEIYRIN